MISFSFAGRVINLTVFDLIINSLVVLSVLALLSAVLINFLINDKDRKEERSMKSIVATGTMMSFFFVFYLTIIRFSHYKDADNVIRYISGTAGCIIVVFSCIFNIAGRKALGSNWANHVKIYERHEFVRTGVYRFVRHPLYASIIWMFYGASLIYLNYISFIITTVLFIPFMVYRAGQEERFLLDKFKEYKEYKKNTQMFFTKTGGNAR